MRLSLFVLLLAMASACNSSDHASNGNVPTPTVDSTLPKVTPTPAPQPTATPVASTPTPSPTPTTTASSGIALIWNGAGACTDGCALAGATAATAAGLTPKYVNESTPVATAADIATLFSNVKVWVMPGGEAYNEVIAMPKALRAALVSFISGGGGYVGWCAGAFAADTSIGTIHKPGLGIFPGNSEVYETTSKQNKYGGSIEKLTWQNETHYFYLEGGPNLTNLPSSVEVIARYDDQTSIAAARTTYGSGRVYISGVHPEAPTWWWLNTGISDPDGSDVAYAADMIKWAAQLE